MTSYLNLHTPSMTLIASGNANPPSWHLWWSQVHKYKGAMTWSRRNGSAQQAKECNNGSLRVSHGWLHAMHLSLAFFKTSTFSSQEMMRWQASHRIPSCRGVGSTSASQAIAWPIFPTIMGVAPCCGCGQCTKLNIPHILRLLARPRVIT